MAFADFVQTEKKLQNDRDTQLKTIFKAMTGFATATANGIVSGMTDPKNGMNQLLKPLTQINTTLSTVANELIGDSVFQEEREREKQIRENELLKVQQRIADAIENLKFTHDSSAEESKKEGKSLWEWLGDKASWLKWLGLGTIGTGLFASGFIGEALIDITKFYKNIILKTKGFFKGVWNGFLKVATKVGEGFNKITKPIRDLFIKIIEPIRPIIDDILKRGSSFFKYIDDFFRGLFNSPIVKIIRTVGTKLKGIGVVIFSRIGDMFSLIGKIAGKLPGAGLVKAGAKSSKSIQVLGQLIMVIDSVVQGFMGFFKGWSEGETLLEKIKGGVSGAIGGVFKAIVGDIVNLGADLIGWLFKKLGNLVGSEGLGNFGKKIMDFDIMKIWDSLWELVMRPVNGIIDFFSNFSENMTSIKQWGANLLSSLREKVLGFMVSLIPRRFGMRAWVADKLGVPLNNEGDVIGSIKPIKEKELKANEITPIQESSRGKNLNTQSNLNNDTKRQINLVSTSMNNVQPITISNGQTAVMMPETATDPNDPISKQLRQAHSY